MTAHDFKETAFQTAVRVMIESLPKGWRFAGASDSPNGYASFGFTYPDTVTEYLRGTNGFPALVDNLPSAIAKHQRVILVATALAVQHGACESDFCRFVSQARDYVTAFDVLAAHAP